MALELIRRLSEHARDRPSASAFELVDSAGPSPTVLSYKQLHRASQALASRIRRELPPGRVILLCYPNRLEYVVSFFGVMAAGATVFPVHPQLSDEELRTAARRSRAAAVLGKDGAIEVLEPLGIVRLECPLDVAPATEPDLDASDTACLLLQSSGTTGDPKIVQRSGLSVDAVARNVACSVGLTTNDRVLGVVPLCHSYGVENGLVGPVHAGACVRLCRQFDTGVVLSELTSGRASVFPGVPSMFEMLAPTAPTADTDGSVDLPNLRSVYSAGAFLPESVFRSFLKRFGVRIGQLFGMTEVGSVTFHDANADDHDPGSVGLPMEGVRAMIVDSERRCLEEPLEPGAEGELAISAPSMLTGYLREEDDECEPPSMLCDGYFFSGDLAKMDKRGRITITGRLKLVVDIGGMKVNLLEVEEALKSHAAVDDCVAVPVPVSETVSRLKAYVIPTDPACEPDPAELRHHLRTRLSAHKIPRVFEVCDCLPRSPTGKILRHRI